MVLHKLQALGRYTHWVEYRSQYTCPLGLSPWTKKQPAPPAPADNGRVLHAAVRAVNQPFTVPGEGSF